MNGKFLFLLMFALNIVSLVVIAALPLNSPDMPGNAAANYVLQFYNVSSSQIASGSGNISVTSSLSSATNAAVNPNTGVAQTGSLLGFIDVVRLTMALITIIISPAGFFALLIVLNVPLVVVVLIGLPVTFLSVISIMEFLRGSSL